MKFADIGLSSEVLRAVDEAGYETPTPIQEKAIPYVLMGRDLLGCAQTGTGKTAGFTLPMIDILASGRARARMPRALILEPTRELAFQVAENFDVYGKYQKLSMALLMGGVSFAEQAKKIDRGVDVLIATPGRLLDHVERGQLMLTGTQILVIDEADRMLDMGFIPDIERIVKLLPPLRQTLFFSATMPPEIRRLADKFLSNPKEVTVAPPASPAETVRQGLTMVPSGPAKRDALRKLMISEKAEAGLIFCNRKRDVDVLARSLKTHGFNAGALHGDMSQPARMETLETFKSGVLKFLVASDVAARGLDISGLPYVFNFDVPTHPEDYVHRIGRTGRAGLSGTALTLATSADSKYITSIERLIGREIPRFDINGPSDVNLETKKSVGEIKAGETKEEGGESEEKGRGRGRTRSRGRKPSPAKQTETAPSAPMIEAAPAVEAVPAIEAAPVIAAAPAIAAASVIEVAPEVQPTPAVSAAPAPKPAPTPRREAEPKLQRDNRSKRYREDDGPSVVGLGDHMPAFLARPVVLPEKKIK